jgi:hypothetical protein
MFLVINWFVVADVSVVVVDGRFTYVLLFVKALSTVVSLAYPPVAIGAYSVLIFAPPTCKVVSAFIIVPVIVPVLVSK